MKLSRALVYITAFLCVFGVQIVFGRTRLRNADTMRVTRLSNTSKKSFDKEDESSSEAEESSQSSTAANRKNARALETARDYHVPSNFKVKTVKDAFLQCVGMFMSLMYTVSQIPRGLYDMNTASFFGILIYIFMSAFTIYSIATVETTAMAKNFRAFFSSKNTNKTRKKSKEEIFKTISSEEYNRILRREKPMTQEEKNRLIEIEKQSHVEGSLIKTIKYGVWGVSLTFMVGIISVTLFRFITRIFGIGIYFYYLMKYGSNYGGTVYMPNKDNDGYIMLGSSSLLEFMNHGNAFPNWFVEAIFISGRIASAPLIIALISILGELTKSIIQYIKIEAEPLTEDERSKKILSINKKIFYRTIFNAILQMIFVQMGISILTGLIDPALRMLFKSGYTEKLIYYLEDEDQDKVDFVIKPPSRISKSEYERQKRQQLKIIGGSIIFGFIILGIFGYKIATNPGYLSIHSKEYYIWFDNMLKGFKPELNTTPKTVAEKS
ncbi:hypothetical protein NECID01_1399 [Nematocida sp. AWRm77]|nr:hypothetical protein NECID01_1399 [Nematocida sp. AWRm77]